MRQGQHNRRGRNRNRKSQNPLSRSYESNGPDVKIRGNAQQIAEKYMSLGRDALSSGDHVLAENYFQHAEHYNRIIMAFREQETGYAGDGSGSGRRFGSPYDAADGDDGDDDVMDQVGQSRSIDPGAGRQPDIDGPPPFEERQPPPQERSSHERHSGERQYSDRHGSGDRGERPSRHERQHRGYDQRRERRHEPREQRHHSDSYQPRYPQAVEPQGNGYSPSYERRSEPQPMVPAEGPVAVAAPPSPVANGGQSVQPAAPVAQGHRSEGSRRRERYVPTLNDQPEFLRRPVKRPRREGAAAENPAETMGAPVETEPAAKDE